MIVIIFRSDNVYRCMSAMTSLIRLSTRSVLFLSTIEKLISAVSEVTSEPFIYHVDALVDALEDSNPEKQCFRALVGLAPRATSFLYRRDDIPDGLAHDIRSRLIRLLRVYRYVLPLSNAQESQDDMTQVRRTRYTHHPH